VNEHEIHSCRKQAGSLGTDYARANRKLAKHKSFLQECCDALEHVFSLAEKIM
jgi:hypothetical protein